MSLRDRWHPQKKSTLKKSLAPLIEEGWEPTDETKALLASEEYEEAVLRSVQALVIQNTNILKALETMSDSASLNSSLRVMAENNLRIIDVMSESLKASLDARERGWSELEVTLDRDKNKLTKTMRIVRKS